MEASSLNRNRSLFFCLSGIMLVFLIGCHEKKTAPDAVEMGNMELSEERNIDGNFSAQDIQKIKNVVTEAMHTAATGKDKTELSEIHKYLDDIQKKVPAYFDNPDNGAEFLKTMMQLTLIAARNQPDNFDLNLKVSSQYIETAFQLEDLDQSKAARRLSNEYKKKGVQAAKDLVEKFPDNGLSYAQLAHCLYVTGGDKKRVADLYKRCLELDEDSDYCRKSYDLLLEELAAPEH